MGRVLKAGAHIADKTSQDIGIELIHHLFSHDSESFKRGQGFFVGSPGGQGIINVHYFADTGEIGNVIPHQAIGVPIAFKLFVVFACHSADVRSIALHGF